METTTWNQFDDPRSYEVDPGYLTPYVPSARDTLEASRRARLVLMQGALRATVEADSEVVDAAHPNLSQAALERVGALAVGFADGTQGVVQEIFGAKPATLPRYVGAYALAA